MSVVWPVSIYVGSLVLAVGVISLWRKRFARARKRTPLTQDLLRSPGESLRESIFDLQTDVFAHLMVFPGYPLMLYAIFLEERIAGTSFNSVVFGFYFLLGLGVLGYMLVKIMKSMTRFQAYRLGLDAELAVAQEFNQLLRDGYRVYHDLPAQGFNIDHVIISAGGVFAVETKGRAKPLKQDGKPQWEVSYDGGALQFPGWRETAPLEQAQRQARWLSEWLSSAVGEAGGVQAVLALPGWYIKRTVPGGVAVFNGKNPGVVLRAIGRASLSESLQLRIAHQIDARCRNIKPLAYGRDKEASSSARR